MTRNRTALYLCAAGLFANLSTRLECHHAFSADNAKKPVIRVEDLRLSTVIGRLGIPLGEVVVIEGIIVLNDSRSKLQDGTKDLHITHVDGRPLDKPVPFWHEFVTWPQKTAPSLGTKVKYAAFETGAFQGKPRGDKWHPSVQLYDFSFLPKLAVVHDFADDASKQQAPRAR